MTPRAESSGLRPPLKWAGGKRWLVPYLKPLWQPYWHQRLIEPFCGGLAVTLALQPERALLSDINPHAVNFYRWLKQGLHINLTMENDSDLYYAHRTRFNQLIAEGKGDSREAAELFYYLNRTDYNGLCRFNRKGEFNAPFGRYKKITYARDFSPYSAAFTGWTFMSGDFESVPIQAEDFIYADPPYDVEFRNYSKEGFTWQDQERLARWLARHPGPVVLSNQATERIKKLYASLGFDLQFHDAPRRISCNGDRAPAPEVLATKNI